MTLSQTFGQGRDMVILPVGDSFLGVGKHWAGDEPRKREWELPCLNPKPLNSQILPSSALIISSRPSSYQDLVISSAATVIGGRAQVD